MRRQCHLQTRRPRLVLRHRCVPSRYDNGDAGGVLVEEAWPADCVGDVDPENVGEDGRVHEVEPSRKRAALSGTADYLEQSPTHIRLVSPEKRHSPPCCINHIAAQNSSPCPYPPEKPR